MHKGITRAGASAVAIILMGAAGAPAHATAFTDFEPDGFTVGETVHNHQTDGTEAMPPIQNINLSPKAWFVPGADNTPPTDEAIVNFGGSHGKVWRLGRGVATGNQGSAPQAPHMDDVAGETGALNDAGRGPVTTSTFYGEFEFRSATGAGQTDLQMNVTGNSFDARHGFVRITDDGMNGLNLGFFDTVEDDFNFTAIATGLSYTDWHKLGIEILFNDGFASGTFGDDDAIGNDVVNIYLDDALIHTGTSWESFYAAVQNNAESVDTLLFYVDNPDIDLAGGGLYYDNVLVTNVGPSQQVPEPGALALFGIGLAGLGLARRRKAA